MCRVFQSVSIIYFWVVCDIALLENMGERSMTFSLNDMEKIHVISK